MECQYCGGECTLYDGGEANSYALEVWVCDECDMWQDEDGDDDLHTRSEAAQDAYARRYG